eukprot:GHVR01091348.1.p1 GENE.GHVR01091348.1~~GHVR01091348.1.p1  ORF type:complete len:1651 (+),score=360.83 GHVR01091348.1:1813-6765(+)
MCLIIVVWPLYSLFFFVFGISCVAAACLLSTLFLSGQRAATVGTMVFLVGVFLKNATHPFMTFKSFFACFLIPQVAFSTTVDLIAQLEMGGVGLKFSTLFNTDLQGRSVFDGICMLLLDTAWMLLLAYYFDVVLPFDYGPRKKWHFPVTCCFKRTTEWVAPTDTLDADMENSEYIERLSPSQVEMVGQQKCVSLVKVFKQFKIDNAVVNAVNGLTLHMFSGEIFALLGHNGAGKTTTMSMMTGMIPFTSGRISVFGRDLPCVEVRKDLGVCPQHDVLWDTLTVLEHLRLFAAFRGMPMEDIDTIVNTMAETFDLGVKKDVYVSQLSGGMKRKLSLAIAFMGDPSVVVLDEPTSGVDPYSRRLMWDVLKKLKTGKLVVLSTHYMDEADALGDRIAVMTSGQVTCCGTSLFLKNAYGCGYILTIILEPNQSVEPIDADIMSCCPLAEKTSCIAAEVTYRIPLNETHCFGVLFRKLDLYKKEDRGILSFGVSVTNLEEVFLKVAENEHINEKKNFTNDEDDKDADTDTQTQALVKTENNELTTGISLLFNQFVALMLKRLALVRRDIASAVCMCVVPLCVLFISLMCVNLFADTEYVNIGLSVANIRKGAHKKGQDVRPIGVEGSVKTLIAPVFEDLAIKNKLWEVTDFLSVDSIDTPTSKETTLAPFETDPSLGSAVEYALSHGDISSGSRLPLELQPFLKMPLNLREKFYNFSQNLLTSATQKPHSNYAAYCLVKGNGMADIYHRGVNNGLLEYLVYAYAKHKESSPAEGNKDNPHMLHDMLQRVYKKNPLKHTRRLEGNNNNYNNYNNNNYNSTINYIDNYMLDNSNDNDDDDGGASIRRLVGSVALPAWANEQVTAAIFVNRTSVHSTGIYLNEYMNSILSGSGIDVKISVDNHPMPMNFKLDFQTKKLAAMVSSFAIILAVGFIPATLVSFYVMEKQKKFKFQQFASGLSGPIYWLSSFIFDSLVICIPLVGVVGLLFAFKAYSYVGRRFINRFLVILGLYANAVLAQTYVLSFLFSDPFTALNATLALNSMCCLVLTVIHKLVEVLSYDVTSQVHQGILDYIFRTMPGFCLGHSFFVMGSCVDVDLRGGLLANCTKLEEPLNTGLDIYMLIIDFFVYLIIACVSEIFFNYTSTKLPSCMNKHKKNLPLDTIEDQDVITERNRCIDMSSEESEQQAIRVQKVGKTYGSCTGTSKLAVESVSFSVAKGEVVALLGVNGAGKTSTMKVLCGEEPANSGSVEINNMNITTHSSEFRRSVGYCPQFDAQLELLTVYEHVKFFALVKGIPFSNVSRIVDSKIIDCGLLKYKDKRAGTLSGGNRRKLSVAVATVGDPAIVFMDEPSCGMDPFTRRFMWAVIHNISRSGGDVEGGSRSSVLVTTHSMEEAEALASRIMIMVGGRIRCIGPAQHIKDVYATGVSLTVSCRLPSETATFAVLKQWDVTDRESKIYDCEGLLDLFEKAAEMSISVLGGVCGGGAGHTLSHLPKHKGKTPSELASFIWKRTTGRNPPKSTSGERIKARVHSIRDSLPVLARPAALVSDEQREKVGDAAGAARDCSMLVSGRLAAEWWLGEIVAEQLRCTLDVIIPGIIVIERQGQLWKFTIPVTSSLADLFDMMESRKEDLFISDYCISQTTMEQVFNRFAAEANAVEN